jgi:sortase A
MKYKKHGRFLIAMGTMLLLAALSLVIWNVCEGKTAVKAAEQVLEKVAAEIPEESEFDGDADDIFTQHEEESAALDIDGDLYIGIISVPEIGLELPVTKECDYDKMKYAACRYSGSAVQRNLIIAAHNYSGFFDRLKELYTGSTVYFTDIHGHVRSYEVTQTEIIGGYNSEAMKSGSDDWDLTLFTCTWSGYSRVTVRAKLKTQ